MSESTTDTKRADALYKELIDEAGYDRADFKGLGLPEHITELEYLEGLTAYLESCKFPDLFDVFNYQNSLKKGALIEKPKTPLDKALEDISKLNDFEPAIAKISESKLRDYTHTVALNDSANRNLISAFRNMQDYYTYITDYAENIPRLVGERMAEIQKNKIALATAEITKDLSRKAINYAIKRFLKQIEDINKKHDKWYIECRDEASLEFVAYTLDPLLVPMYDECEDCASDQSFVYYGIGRVRFRFDSIQGIYVGGIADALDRLSTDVHPHLSSNGSYDMCMGNYADAIIQSMKGDTIATAKQIIEELKVENELNRNTVLKTLIQGSSTKNVVSGSIGSLYTLIGRDTEQIKEQLADDKLAKRLSMLYGINNIEMYLASVYALLTDVNYDSPYITLSESELDDRAQGYEEECDDDGDYHNPFACFDDVVSSEGMDFSHEINILRKFPERLAKWKEMFKKVDLNYSPTYKYNWKEVEGIVAKKLEENVEVSNES